LELAQVPDRRLVDDADVGDVAATKELLQRLLGPPENIDLMDRLTTLEQKLEQLAEARSNGWQRS